MVAKEKRNHLKNMIDHYFCADCSPNPPIVDYSTERPTLGCKKCRINSQKAALVYYQGFRWARDTLTIATGLDDGELLVSYALNGGKALIRGDAVQEPMRDSRFINNIYETPIKNRARECLALLKSNISLWKSPIQESIKYNHCVPLAVLTWSNITNVVVSKIILRMIGNCFIDKTEVWKLFETVVYNSVSQIP